MTWFKNAVEAVHAIGVVYTLASIAALAIEMTGVHLLTTSHVLELWIAVGAITGGTAGYFRTAFAFAGQGRPKSLKAAKRYMTLALVFYLIVIVVPLTIIEVPFAERHSSIRTIREFLITAPLLFNFIVSVGAALAAFFSIGGFVVLSPHVANPRGGIYGSKH